jgi:hypothetical protein
MVEKPSRETIGEHLMDYMLAIIGKTRMDMIDSPNYRFEFTLTREQQIVFGEYAIFVLQKTFKFNKKKAVDTFKWFWDKFGVRIKG